MKKIILLLVLLMFPLTVLADVPRDATLSWLEVTTYEDGTPATIAGYKVHCRRGLTGEYTYTKDVGNVLTYRISNDLANAPDWACVVAAYDIAGDEGAYSNEATFPLARRLAGSRLTVK